MRLCVASGPLKSLKRPSQKTGAYSVLIYEHYVLKAALHVRSARTRRSALKARQHLKPGSHTAAEASLEETMKVVRTLKRHRKQRHAKLRELTREDEDGAWWGGRSHGDTLEGDGMACPVCSKFVRGDVDVVEAHVDSCLAYEKMRHEEEEAERGRHRRDGADVDLDDDVDVDGEGDVMFGVMEGVSLRGTYHSVRLCWRRR